LKDHNEKWLRDRRPSIDVDEAVNYCLQALFDDKEHCFKECFASYITFEELIGALLLMEDRLKEDRDSLT